MTFQIDPEYFLSTHIRKASLFWLRSESVWFRRIYFSLTHEINFRVRVIFEDRFGIISTHRRGSEGLAAWRREGWIARGRKCFWCQYPLQSTLVGIRHLISTHYWRYLCFGGERKRNAKIVWECRPPDGLEIAIFTGKFLNFGWISLVFFK